jgi:hypothetical protein
LRDLNAVNIAAKSTKFVFTISLIIPIIMGLGALALANGAAPTQPLRDNYLEILSLGIIALAIIALPMPYVFKWNWEAKYFGASMFSLASGSIVGIYPMLCIVQYGALPLVVRIAIALLACAITIQWCNRFVKAYKMIYKNEHQFQCLYEEESDAVYYLQQGDKKILNKLPRADLFPGSKYFLLSLSVAFSMIPFASSISEFIGLPFIHVFLAVSATPLNLMFIGMATKMWLVYYFYPHKIKRNTNKPVFVDMSSQPLKSINSGS